MATYKVGYFVGSLSTNSINRLLAKALVRVITSYSIHYTKLYERFNYASRIAEQFRGLKVAFVVNQPLRDPNLFGETVAVNRGGNIRVLATLAEAYEWLEVTPANKAAGGDGK